jgi:hypothetical protein
VSISLAKIQSHQSQFRPALTCRFEKRVLLKDAVFQSFRSFGLLKINLASATSLLVLLSLLREVQRR